MNHLAPQDDQDDTTQHALMVPASIQSIVDARDLSLATMTSAAQALQAALNMASKARGTISDACLGFDYFDSHGDGDNYDRLSTDRDFDQEAAINYYRLKMDRRIWRYTVESLGITTLMDKQAKDEFYQSLVGDDVPEITFDNVTATLQGLLVDRELIFKRGLANAFGSLDRRFKSHDGFKLGSRIILEYVFDQWGSFNHGWRRDTLIDVERVFAVLDGNNPNPNLFMHQIEQDRGRGMDPRQSVTETEYFRVKGFKNGNAHLWFTRDDLVEKANKMLAEYYGEVLPDGMAVDEGFSKGLKLPAKELQFYATPPAVVDRIMGELHITKGSQVLEPSAGNGAFVRPMVERGWTVDAIEIHPDRVDRLRQIPGVRRVIGENFLCCEPTPIYDLVVMNPPFYGTHWMDHLRHAWDFLVPGGDLVAVLPISAEVGESKRHVAFRRWLEKVTPSYDRILYRDLPEGSFEASGTMINTVWLKLKKPRV